MATLDDINLLKTKTGLSPEFIALEARLKWVSSIAFIALIVAGAILIGADKLLNSKKQNLLHQKKTLLTSITNESEKEYLFVTVKERLPLLEKALATQKPWEVALDTILSFVAPPQLVSIDLDEKDAVKLTIHTSTAEEALSYVDRVVELTREKRVSNPQLLFLELDEDGSVQFVLSFVSIFSL